MRFEIEARVRRPNGFRLEASFACEAGTLAVLGPSGSGKSTLLAGIAGVEPGSRVVLDGEDLSGLPLHERRIATVTQDALLFPHLPVRGNLLYSPGASGEEAVARDLGIAHLLDRMPRNLSGGERRRVALGRALLSRPRLLLLDEPFAGRDDARRDEALALLRRVRERQGLPMILVTHRTGEAAALADRTLRLEDGRVIPEGSP